MSWGFCLGKRGSDKDTNPCAERHGRHYGAAASHEYPEQGFRFSAGYRCQDEKLLTAANTKLAVSLGISNAAATALMATLTLGLSAVITGLIVLWDKYSDAQEKAAEKAKERVK